MNVNSDLVQTCTAGMEFDNQLQHVQEMFGSHPTIFQFEFRLRKVW